jgi:3-hydroxy-9,10-secoandrosta-1,3,5(10)-triene-9,17-dione monooxygenase
VNTAIPNSTFRASPSFANADEAVAAAQSLLPLIRASATANDVERGVSRDVIAEIKQAGLFSVVGAKMFGGAEAGIEALLRVTIEIASACGSTGWVYGVLAGHSWMLNLFPREAQEDIASEPDQLTATVFRLGGEARQVEGGFQINGGFGRFCSGVEHADWVLVGMTAAMASGQSQQLFLLVPKSEVIVLDDWYTVGMRGTGSRSIEIPSAFVPEHRSVLLSDMLAGTTPGATLHDKGLYRMGFGEVTPFSIVGAPLGMARSAIEQFASELRESIKADGPKPYQDGLFLRLAKAATAVDAAINLVVQSAAKVDRLGAPEAFDEVSRRELPRNWAWAVQTCRDAVNEVYEAAGGSVIYDKSSLQRIWRDVNSGAQHFGFTEDKAMIDYARACLDLSPEQFVLGKAKRN